MSPNHKNSVFKAYINDLCQRSWSVHVIMCPGDVYIEKLKSGSKANRPIIGVHFVLDMD